MIHPFVYRVVQYEIFRIKIRPKLARMCGGNHKQRLWSNAVFGDFIKIITKGWVIYNQRSRKEWPDNWHSSVAFTSFLFGDRCVWQVVKLCTQIEIHKVHKIQKGWRPVPGIQAGWQMSHLLNTYCTFYTIIKASLDFLHGFLTHKFVMTLKIVVNKPQQHTQFL